MRTQGLQAQVADGALSQNPQMDTRLPLPLLGGLTPERFMQRHWHKQPLWVRQAWPGLQPPVTRSRMFELAASEGVESRCVWVDAGGRWRVRQGPLPRRSLPPLSRPGWTLLVQGLELHAPPAAAMLERFAFLPHARLDDLMLSWASPEGGVGAHLDSYDVFLLQVQGRRRWRIGPVQQPVWAPAAPLKLLQHFEPAQEQVLDPGDLLYLPPGWGHEGTAVGGDCMTCSVGFRAPTAGELAHDLLLRLADGVADAVADAADADLDGSGGRDRAARATAYLTRRYRDPRQSATAHPGQVQDALTAFAHTALQRALADPQALARALGEVLSEPKPQVWFNPHGGDPSAGTVRLAAGTRMLYDAHHVFINGEAFAAAGRDATLMRLLADTRRLPAIDRARLSAPASALVDDWLDDGWLEADAA
ncbi:MAG: cupin domain-containing protein [Rubrivivax sp.]